MSDSRPAGVIQMARLYTDIALFRRGPEDVPVSAVLLAVTVIAYMFVSLALSLVMPITGGDRIGLIALDASFGVAWYWVVMRLVGRPERFLQTATAIFGYLTILQPAFDGAMWLFLRFMKDPVWQLPASLLLLALAIWTLAADSRILRSATGWPLISCVALVILQAVMSRLVIVSVFPDSATP